MVKEEKNKLRECGISLFCSIGHEIRKGNDPQVLSQSPAVIFAVSQEVRDFVTVLQTVTL
jgi:hypothetical protein